MKKILIISAVLVLFCGCSSVTGPTGPVTVQKYFVLDKPELQPAGKGVVGLNKGVYVSEGRDKTGTYYRGKGYSAIVLYNAKAANEYRETGELPQLAKLFYLQGSSLGGEGGIWIPDDLSRQEPVLYFYQDFRFITEESESKIPLAPHEAEGVDQNRIPEWLGAAKEQEEYEGGGHLGKAMLKSFQGQIVPSVKIENENVLEAITRIKEYKK